MIEDGRPQDQGRRHRKRGAPTIETLTLLAQFREAQRAELRDCLAELAGEQQLQTTLDGVELKMKRPNLTQRIKLWDLAIKLAHDLGTEVDSGQDVADDAETPARRRRVEY